MTEWNRECVICGHKFFGGPNDDCPHEERHSQTAVGEATAGVEMMSNPETTISITAEGPNEFTVRIGERYHAKMTWEEMLGQIAELTHPRIDKARFWMLTANEWAEKETARAK